MGSCGLHWDAMHVRKPLVIACLFAVVVAGAGVASAAPDPGPPDGLPEPVPDFVSDLLDGIGEMVDGILSSVFDMVGERTPDAAGDGLENARSNAANGG